MSAPAKPILRQALAFWFKLGFISFGGPAGQIAIMHDYLVDKKKWVSNSRFVHALNYCMVLPGPEAQQLSIYMGWLLNGTIGGLAAGILFVLPSAFILAGLSIVYVLFGKLPWVYALFEGLKPAIVAIVIVALIKIARRSLSTPVHYIFALLSFVCIFFFNVPFPIIIIAAFAMGYITQKLFKDYFQDKKEAKNKLVVEDEYYINANTVNTEYGFNWKRLTGQVINALVIWCLPLAALYFLMPDFDFWKSMTFFFTKAALVTFGGAYAVLPYVAQVSVEKLRWLSKLQMLDGLALGETTPGPLIMVLAFVGFMASYNHSGSIGLACLGLGVTAFYTFMPCFFYVFAGAPIIEKTQNNPAIKNLLSFVTAAVAGVILNLTIYFGIAVVLPKGWDIQSINYANLIWIAVSFIALYRFKIKMLLWIAISAVAGLGYWWVVSYL